MDSPPRLRGQLTSTYDQSSSREEQHDVGCGPDQVFVTMHRHGVLAQQTGVARQVKRVGRKQLDSRDACRIEAHPRGAPPYVT
jgi:hypothetical protein